jgi:hypothetical protein
MQILLDIDGVMVPANSWKQPSFHTDGFAEFSPIAVKALKRILKAPNASLVLTTSHKKSYSLQQWVNIFQTRGVAVSSIEVLNENDMSLSRKDEVINWLTHRKRDLDFIIIDDDKSLNDLPAHFKQRLLLTDGAIGLTDLLADKALALCISDQHE